MTSRPSVSYTHLDVYKRQGLLQYLNDSPFDGRIVLEVNTRKADNHAERVRELREVADNTRLHLGQLDAARPGASPTS